MKKKNKKILTNRKRRTNKEICVDLKRERNKLYKVRSKSLRLLKESNVSGKVKKIANSKLERSNIRINRINVRMVKCSIRWGNFKKNKRRIRVKINSLKHEIKSGDLITTDINRKIHEIREFSFQIQLLESKMYEKYLDQVILPKATPEFNSLDNGNIIEQYLVVWELKDKVQDAISTMKFDVIDINGEYQSVIDLGAVIMDIDMFIANIADKQHLTATPMVILIFDFLNRIIRVVNNTSEI